MFRGHAFVDWDDTLAENIAFFNAAEEEMSRLIAEATGAGVAAVRSKGQELDLLVARTQGLGRESFPGAWLQCYAHFCSAEGRSQRPEVLDAIRRVAAIPYEIKQPLVDGAESLLSWLHSQRFEVTIWTTGDREVQQRKLRESGLSHLVHRQVVAHKSPETLLEALDGRPRERAFVIGNSLSSDVAPALMNAMLALHVPVETWGYDVAHVDESDPNYVRLHSLMDVPAVLAQRFFRRAV